MKFSVLLPTRNRLDLLSRAIETVRRQDYDNWEVIVSDNFSDEDVEGYIRTLCEPRIKYFRTESFIPVTDNWNNALDKSDGDYIIMLGDDDCLMRGYFSILSDMIAKFDYPDFIYTSAFLYAYPGVMPGAPEGFLRAYDRRKIFQSSSESFLLEKDAAMSFVRDSFDFRVAFDYNMQFSLVSRRLIDEMKCYGPFYQSPYPDYYASNAIMLKAERILIVPRPLVTIGISPKSFGYYYFNNAERAGNEFLNNLPDQEMVSRLEEVILPGSAMNTSWLIAMETLSANFGDNFGVKVNYGRYRRLQILSTYFELVMRSEHADKACDVLRPEISFTEWLRYGLWLIVMAKIVPKRYRLQMSRWVRVVSGALPVVYMPTVEGKFSTILDVFEQVKHKNR